PRIGPSGPALGFAPPDRPPMPARSCTPWVSPSRRSSPRRWAGPPSRSRPPWPAGAMTWWTAPPPACPSWAGTASESLRGAGADRRETPRPDTGRLRADDLAAGSGPGHGDPRPVGHAGADHRRGRPGRRRPGTPADGGTRYRGRTRL